MTTTTALLVLIFVLVALLLGGTLFHLVHARPVLASPLMVAMGGITLMVACAATILSR